MASDPMRITASDLKKIEEALEEVEDNGAMVRRLFGEYNNEEFDVSWEVVAAVEAMKAKHDVKAPCAGRVTAVHASIGNEVSAGKPILSIES